jgi:DNA-binding transcriptional LysR family regulator
VKLEWLDDILAVAETGSFTEAAERRRVTQSAFSRRIRQIEDHIGVQLFDRGRKPVQLRPTTAEHRDQIARLARTLHQLTDDLRRGERTTGHRLVLASQHALTASWAPRFTAAVRARNREIFLTLRSANRDECLSMLLTRQADIAVVYRELGETHPLAAQYIETVVVNRDRLVPVFSVSHELQLMDSFSKGYLPIIAYPHEVFMGKAFDRMVLGRIQEGPQFFPVAETALTLAAVEMAAAGIGVAWAPASLVRDRIRRGELADLSDILPGVEFEVVALRLTDPVSETEREVWAHLGAGEPLDAAAERSGMA